MSAKNKQITMVIPNLTRSEATKMKRSFIDIKQRTAPSARATISFGLKKNFIATMRRCNNVLGG